MATQMSMLHIRVDDEIKEQATAVLAATGLSISEAVRLSPGHRHMLRLKGALPDAG